MYKSLLVGCAPGWRSSVVRLVVFIASTATASAVFFVAIVHPVAGSKSALVQITIVSNKHTRQYRISRRVCSVSPEVGVSSCSRSCCVRLLESAAAGRYRRLEWHGVMRRSWRMSRANVDRTVQGGGSCGTCCLSAIASTMRLGLAISLTFLTPSLGPSSLSLRGPRGGAGARLSGLRPPPPPLPPPRC